MNNKLMILFILLCLFLIGCGSADNGRLTGSEVEQETTIDKKNINEKGDVSYYNGEKRIGNFYSLEKAFELGLLTLDDLEKIIDINHGDTEFYEEIDIEGEYKIKNDRLFSLLNNYNYKDAKMDDIKIVKYYGNYNGAYVISFIDTYSIPIGLLEHGVAVIVSSDPLRINYFKYYGEYPIVVWSEDVYE